MNKNALITGASSGIGKALAFEYARNGFDLILTSRKEAALKSVADECSARFGVTAEIFPADLSDPGSTDGLIEYISDRHIYTLINNAGSAIKGDFAETDISQEILLMNLQLAAMLKLTKAALPKMIDSGDARIVNIASVYSYSAVPKQAVYAACKAFILSFSAALDHEVRDKGVKVTVVCPGTTQTRFRSRAGINDKDGAGMPAEDVARFTFAASSAGRSDVVPGTWNKLFATVSKHLPITLATSLVSFINDRRGVNK